MNENEAQLDAKLVIQGTLECRDKDGNLLKTIEIKGEIPVVKEEDNGNQRSE